MLISLTRRGDEKPSNVVIRGTSARGLELRPQVRLAAGRAVPARAPPRSSSAASIAARFDGTGIGDQLRFAQRDWTVVGIFDAGGSGFDSEIWGDAEQLMQSFRRTSYSSMVARLADPGLYESFRADVGADPRLTNEMKREQTFYSDQSRALSTFINVLGLTLSIIFSIGAMIGAMITMYASVANRVGGDRHPARARLPAQRRARGVPGRGAAAGAGRRRARPRARLVHAARLVLDDQLPDLRRPVVSLRR